MTGFLFYLLFPPAATGFAVLVAVAVQWKRLRWVRATEAWAGGWMVYATAMAIGGCIAMAWLDAAGAQLSFAIAAMIFWWLWHRPRRRRVFGLAGAKTRALRDAIVRKARQARKPRPVLRPVPQA